jgi:glucose/arabinose dehydrogenase
MSRISLFPLLAILFSIDSLCLFAQTTLKTRVVADSLRIPWEMRLGKDGYLWVTERNGTFSRIDTLTGAKRVIYRFQDVRAQGEGGLLGFDFHPDFPATPHVYASYVYSATNAQALERIVRLTYLPDKDTLTDRQTLLDNIRAANIHNGSRLLFGPDRKLYITTGDAALPNLSLDTTSLNGKILRMNEDGSIPDDNPFPGSYIWSFGHRNAQGICFDKKGRLYASEHGAQTDDEVNLILKGRNYGWPTVEGFCDEPAEKTYCDANNVVEPPMAWSPTIAPSSIVYYDHDAIPEWKNAIILVTMNLRGRDLRVLKLNTNGDSITKETILFDQNFGRIRAMCLGHNGKIYIATSNQEANGRDVVKPDDDKIIEIYNPIYTSRHPAPSNNTLFAYPNPAESGVFLFSQPVTGAVYNIFGTEILHLKQTEQLDLSDRSGQIYLLRTNTGTVIKLIKP